jgi:hypothetical protein
MNVKLARLALALGLTAVVAATALAATSAAAPVTSLRLFAKAGPVTMHASVTLTLGPVTGTTAIGALSHCTVVKPASSPRSGVADKLVCTNAAGQKVVVQVAPTSASLSYQLASSNQHMSMAAAAIQIRHAGAVLFTLTPSTGTLAIPMSHLAELLNGHDQLSVQSGTHSYHGKIVRVS